MGKCFVFVFKHVINLDIRKWPSGGTGIHRGLKIPREVFSYGFNSRLGHHKMNRKSDGGLGEKTVVYSQFSGKDAVV